MSLLEGIWVSYVEYILAIMISLLITGPGFLSIEKNLLKREMFPKSHKYSTTTTKKKKDGSLK